MDVFQFRERLIGDPVQIAIRIKDRIWEEKGLTCSIGIGPNVMLAKVAGDMKTAYKIVATHAAESAANAAEAEFHAGWYALRGLKDAASAATHFSRIAELAEACRSVGILRPLLVTDPSLAGLPMVAEAARNPYGDTPAPKTFQHVSPLDPQLFASIDEHARELLGTTRSGKYSRTMIA